VQHKAEGEDVPNTAIGGGSTLNAYNYEAEGVPQAKPLEVISDFLVK